MTSRPRIYLSPPHMSGEETAEISRVIAENWVAPVGPDLAAFEREAADYLGVQHAVALASGTAALHLALMQLRLEPGDEVYCSSLTFAGSIFPAMYERAAPVFIDSDFTTWNMDPNLLADELARAAKRGKLPKAVIVVDLYGQSADWDKILPICERYEVPVIEDAAEALGATYRGHRVGSFGKCSVLSFNGNKIITTSGGGMLLSNDAKVIEQARFISQQAKEPFPYYHHCAVGHNYRMSNVLAALGRAQLRALPSRVEARRANFAYYRQALHGLPGIEFMPEADFGTATRWLTCMLLRNPDLRLSPERLRMHLESQNIESRPVWKPMHLQPVFSGCRVVGGDVALDLFQHGLCLPSGSSLTAADLERICESIREAFVGSASRVSSKAGV